MGSSQTRGNRPKRLGRGLSAMIGASGPAEIEAKPDTKSDNTDSPESQGQISENQSPAAGAPDRVPDARGRADGARPEGGSGAAPDAPEAIGDGPVDASGAPVRNLAARMAGEPGGTALSLALSSIEPGKHQPRRVFDADALGELAESIRTHGLIQPVVVRPVADQPGRFELIAGERRWRAAKIAGLERIPAVVRDVLDRRAAEWALIENIQRTDLNPMERARGLRSLGEHFGLNHGQIGERLGMGRSTVANLVRLTELEPEVQELLESGALDMGHGRALVATRPGAARVALAQRAAREGWPVRRMEEHASGTGNSGGASGESGGRGVSAVIASRPAAVVDLEKRLGEHLGTKVRIATDRSGTKGKVTIEFFDLDHFDGLVSRMGFRGE